MPPRTWAHFRFHLAFTVSRNIIVVPSWLCEVLWYIWKFATTSSPLWASPLWYPTSYGMPHLRPYHFLVQLSSQYVREASRTIVVGVRVPTCIPFSCCTDQFPLTSPDVPIREGIQSFPTNPSFFTLSRTVPPWLHTQHNSHPPPSHHNPSQF